MRKLLYLFCFVCLTHMALYGQSEGTLQLEQIRSFTFSNKGNVEFLTFNKRGNRIASVGYGHVINIWDANSGNLIQSLQGHEDIINHLVFNKDGNQIASASNDGTIKLWDLETAREIQSFKNPIHFKQKAAYFVIFSPDEKYLYFGGKNAKLSTAEIGSKALPEVLFLGKYHTTSASLSPDQKTMVFACGNRLHFLNFATGEIEESAANGGHYINDIKFSHDGKTLGGWSEEGSLRFWKYPNHKENWHIPAGDKDYSYISFSTDDQLIAHGNAANMFKIWNVKERKLELVAAGHQGKVKTLAFSPNGKYIASGGYDGKVILWALNYTPKEEPKEEKPEPVVEEKRKPITPPKVMTASITPPKVSTPKPPIKKPLPKKPEPKIEIAKEIPKPEPKVELVKEIPKPEPKVEVVKETPKPKPEPKVKKVLVKKAKPAYAIDLGENGMVKSINRRIVKLVGTLKISGNQVVLDTWDDGVVDGDKISVFLNGECILDKYELLAGKKRINGTINPSIDNYLIVYAYNVGPKAPAIAALAKEGAEESDKIRMTADYRYCEALKIIQE
ncbi:MAG: WD40 repeat domain-containing protein [Chitinophagales bacterium]